ncbi:MAG: dihydroneopterin aldolase [Myxococcota bacterium]|nr:dihydroneopterin aldolase [Myxococcota bacterium]
MSERAGRGDRIFLEGIGFVGRHGVYAEERVAGQRFEVDLELRHSCVRAAATDSLADTVDYAELAGLVLEIGTQESFQLVERLAERIADRVLARYPEVRLTVTVRKYPHGIPGNPRFAGVTLRRGPRRP